MISYFNNSQKSVSILLSIAILSRSYPLIMPLLIGILATFFVFLKIITGRFKIRINIGIIIFYFCVLTYIIGLSFNQGIIYNQNIYDIANIVSLLLILILLSDLKREDYPNLINTFARYGVFTSFLVSLISLYKFYHLQRGVRLSPFFSGPLYPDGTSLVIDYNMFCFALSSGLIMSIYLFGQVKNRINRIYYFVSTLVIFISI